MKLQIKKCRTCGALGVGPRAVKLFPLDGLLYCGPDFKTALQWHEQRTHVTGGIEREDTLYKEMAKFARDGIRIAKKPHVKWEPYIQELCGIAGWAFGVGDRRTFVYYAARALYAWTLKEIA